MIEVTFDKPDKWEGWHKPGQVFIILRLPPNHPVDTRSFNMNVSVVYIDQYQQVMTEDECGLVYKILPAAMYYNSEGIYGRKSFINEDIKELIRLQDGTVESVLLFTELLLGNGGGKYASSNIQKKIQELEAVPPSSWRLWQIGRERYDAWKISNARTAGLKNEMSYIRQDRAHHTVSSELHRLRLLLDHSKQRNRDLIDPRAWLGVDHMGIDAAHETYLADRARYESEEVRYGRSITAMVVKLDNIAKGMEKLRMVRIAQAEIVAIGTAHVQYKERIPLPEYNPTLAKKPFGEQVRIGYGAANATLLPIALPPAPPSINHGVTTNLSNRPVYQEYNATDLESIDLSPTTIPFDTSVIEGGVGVQEIDLARVLEQPVFDHPVVPSLVFLEQPAPPAPVPPPPAPAPLALEVEKDVVPIEDPIVAPEVVPDPPRTKKGAKRAAQPSSEDEAEPVVKKKAKLPPVVPLRVNEMDPLLEHQDVLSEFLRQVAGQIQQPLASMFVVPPPIDSIGPHQWDIDSYRRCLAETPKSAYIQCENYVARSAANFKTRHAPLTMEYIVRSSNSPLWSAAVFLMSELVRPSTSSVRRTRGVPVAEMRRNEKSKAAALSLLAGEIKNYYR